MLLHCHPFGKCMLLLYRGKDEGEVRDISAAFGFDVINQDTADTGIDAVVLTHGEAYGIKMTDMSLNTALTKFFGECGDCSKLCFFKEDNDAAINGFITNLDATHADNFNNVYYKVGE